MERNESSTLSMCLSLASSLRKVRLRLTQWTCKQLLTGQFPPKENSSNAFWILPLYLWPKKNFLVYYWLLQRLPSSETLCLGLVLIQPDPSQQFIVGVDASDSEVGAVLFQQKNGKIHSVHCWCLQTDGHQVSPQRTETLDGTSWASLCCIYRPWKPPLPSDQTSKL